MKKEDNKPENYEVAELDILGMSCVNCANSIKTYLVKVDGIYNVEVNFTSEMAGIEYNPYKISKEEIISDIRKMGYDVMEEEDEDEFEKVKKQQLSLQRKKIITSLILAFIVIIISMSGHSEYLEFIQIPPDSSLVILFILSSVVVFWCGDKFHKGALQAIKNKSSDMNTLISMGVFASYFYSIVISANHIFKLNIPALNNSHEVYYETAVMIISFILIGNHLEAVLKSKTQTSIKKLKNLQSKYVNVIRDDEEITIPYKKVRFNDIVIIKSGDKIPVDGSIIEGYCVVDESAMTGESHLIEKKPGNEMISGTIVKNGYVKMRALKVGNETLLSQIIHLVKEASNSKPKIQRLADKISSIFVPTVLGIALITFLIWYFALSTAFDVALLYAVSVLIIACPCALGLASPMAVVIGIGRSAENGILFNNVEAIEKMNKIDTVCFDKTGTLTEGEMTVKKMKLFGGIDKNELLQYVFSVEKFSNHPIAKSITAFCVEKKIGLFDGVENLINEEIGGISAIVNERLMLIGSESLMIEKNVRNFIPDLSNSKGILYVGIDNELAGIIEFEDKIKSEAKEIVKRFIQKGFGIFMISGDSEKVTKAVANELGIENYSFKTLPDQKESIITKLQSENKNVAMVGDGINDAPSLAKANIGVALGTGQDIAIESADVILVKGDLRNLLKAINISSKTVSIIKQNIFWAFFYNVLAIPLAAGVLSPFGIVISPVMAAMFMAFSDVVTVIGNSLRLKYVKID
ncbi:MAG: heavy metal translocating P-type ATPase [Ignavibacteriae bacterium]|nr:heavy metal translocating P-type ATPase [Ignavibacteriota bacterium]